MSSELTPHEAVLQKKIDCLSRFLENGGDVNLRDYSNSTPLHIAAYEGNVEAVSILIEHGAKVNLHDNSRRTPLVLAVLEAQADVVQLLLDNLAAKNWIQEDTNRTLLHLAVIKPHVPNVQMIQMLLDAGMKLGEQDKDHWTALDHAISLKLFDVTKCLLQAGALKHESEEWVLRQAIKADDLEIVRLLIDEFEVSAIKDYVWQEKWVDSELPALYWEEPIHLASQTGNVEIAKFLLSRGASPNALSSVDTPPLYLALANLADEDAYPVAAVLLEAGADPSLLDMDHGAFRTLGKPIRDLLDSYRNRQ
jgi:ankyrin repeat protein